MTPPPIVRSVVRSASLTGYPEIARAAGLDPLHMMRDAGLHPRCLDDPETRIDAMRVRRLLEACALAGPIPDLGLRMARARRLSSLGPISLLIRDEPTARSALETLLKHMSIVNEALVTRIDATDDLVIIREDFRFDGGAGEGEPRRQSIELAVGVMAQILRELLGPAWRARRVCFTHGAPPNPVAGHLASYTQAFGRAVEFDADFNGIVCGASELAARNPSADPAMARYAKQYIATLLAAPESTTTQIVARLIDSMLPVGRATIEAIADDIGVNRRTIHRRLALEGTTFSVLLDAARRERVVRYLEPATRSAADIADALGFSSLPALSRWFHTAFGASMTEWRARRTAAR
jgi:AraC-like DNA-binding protein